MLGWNPAIPLQFGWTLALLMCAMIARKKDDTKMHESLQGIGFPNEQNQYKISTKPRTWHYPLNTPPYSCRVASIQVSREPSTAITPSSVKTKETLSQLMSCFRLSKPHIPSMPVISWEL
jgi:hypothetical protein